MEACLPRRSHWAAVPSIRSRSMATTALITGGTSGIGRATANKLAQLGVHVVVVGRNVDRGEKTIAEIRKAGGQADFIPSDLRDASSARVVARKALEVTNGQVDILVNAVSPGPTRTEGTDAMGEGLERLAAEAPAHRPGTADEIAEAIVFLATDRASFIHGAKLAVDGGRTA